MEHGSQAKFVHRLTSGKAVFFDDVSTGQQVFLPGSSSASSNSTQAPLKSAAYQEKPKLTHSIGTQTNEDIIYRPTIAMATRHDDPKGRGTTDTKRYSSTGTETDLNAIGNRNTLELLLRWALAICTSDGNFCAQDARELQYSNRNSNPLPSFPEVYQRGKTTSDQKAEYGLSTKRNNDTPSDVLGETFTRADHPHLVRPLSSTFGSSDDMHAEENVVLSMETEHHVANELHPESTDNLQVNLLHFDRTSNKQQQSSVGVSNIQQNSVSEMVVVHLGKHLPVYASDGTSIKEEYVINEEANIQEGPGVGVSKEAITDSDAFYQNTSSSSMSVSGKAYTNSSHNMAAGSIHSCGMEVSVRPEDYSNDKERSTLAVEKPHRCDVCGKRYRTKYLLKQHLRSHTKEKPFQCDICKKKFTMKCNLKVHMRLHSQEKPYACTICGKRFTASGNLTTHMHVHTGERPYLCQICGKRFSQQCGLKDHLPVHTGEKPFACKECGEKFRSRSGRDKHVRTHECAKSS